MSDRHLPPLGSNTVRRIAGRLRRSKARWPKNVEWDLRAERDDQALAAFCQRELRPGSNSLDVGAHQGKVLDLLLGAAPNGSHIAVEPIPDMARSLRTRYPQVEVHECALAGASGQATFFLYANRPAWSGLRQQSAIGEAGVREISVELRTLDELIGDRRLDVIKIDVEGGELAVLEGARHTLLTSRPIIVFEHAHIHASNFETAPADVWQLLADAKYGITPLADETRILARHEFIGAVEAAFESGYDRNAITNWIAKPS